MRYLKGQKQASRMPELNLVPMMDVIMTVLTFFIIVSMTLTSTQSADLSLPSVADATQKDTEQLPEPLIISLDRDSQTFLDGKATTIGELDGAIAGYLEKNPKGAVLLKADQKLAYEKVVQVLTRLQKIGGERVSLAIEAI